MAIVDLAETGDAQAQETVAFMYASGMMGEVDMDKAIKWYKLAAKQGVKTASKSLSTLLQDENVSESIYWLMLASKQGDAVAQSLISLKYAKGIFIKKERVLAIAWMLTAISSASSTNERLPFSMKEIAADISTEEMNEAKKKAKKIRKLIEKQEWRQEIDSTSLVEW
jgi:TPR repeat protein